MKETNADSESDCLILKNLKKKKVTFNENTSRCEAGLPFKEYHEILNDNYFNCKKCFNSLSKNLDQVYSNTRISTQLNTSQHESTRVRHESIRVRHESTRINTNLTRVNTSLTRVKTNQYESDTSQDESTRV